MSALVDELCDLACVSVTILTRFPISLPGSLDIVKG